MSKQTIRKALGLPVVERPRGLFVLTRDDVAAALAETRATYDAQGYHTFGYWREHMEGMAALGEALVGRLTAADAVTFRELWAEAGEVKP